MLSLLRAWRERGWSEIDAAAYAQAWQRFGGSVATHPLIVERLAALARIPVRYLGWFAGGELLAIRLRGIHQRGGIEVPVVMFDEVRDG